MGVGGVYALPMLNATIKEKTMYIMKRKSLFPPTGGDGFEVVATFRSMYDLAKVASAHMVEGAAEFLIETEAPPGNMTLRRSDLPNWSPDAIRVAISKVLI